MTDRHTWGLRAVQQRSTTDHVLAELRAAIVSGRIGPREPLREAALARMLGTGRSAIREAIRQLVQEGLVEYRLNRGSFVRVLSVDDVDDVYLAREAIEVAAIRHALEQKEDLALEALQAAVERLIAAADATSEGEPAGAELIEADLDFHREIVRLSASPRLARTHETLAAEAQMLMHHQPVYSTKEYAADHTILMDAISRNDPSAPDLVRDHLRLSARLIEGEIAKLSGPGDEPSDKPQERSIGERRITA